MHMRVRQSLLNCYKQLPYTTVFISPVIVCSSAGTNNHNQCSSYYCKQTIASIAAQLRTPCGASISFVPIIYRSHFSIAIISAINDPRSHITLTCSTITVGKIVSKKYTSQTIHTARLITQGIQRTLRNEFPIIQCTFAAHAHRTCLPGNCGNAIVSAGAQFVKKLGRSYKPKSRPAPDAQNATPQLINKNLCQNICTIRNLLSDQLLVGGSGDNDFPIVTAPACDDTPAHSNPLATPIFISPSQQIAHKYHCANTAEQLFLVVKEIAEHIVTNGLTAAPLQNLQRIGNFDAASILRAITSSLNATSCSSVSSFVESVISPPPPPPGCLVSGPIGVDTNIIFILTSVLIPLLVDFVSSFPPYPLSTPAPMRRPNIVLLYPDQAHILIGSPLPPRVLKAGATEPLEFNPATHFPRAAPVPAINEADWVISLYCHHQHFVVAAIHIEDGLIIPLDSAQSQPATLLDNARIERIVTQARNELAQLRSLKSTGTLLSPSQLIEAACCPRFQVVPFKAASQSVTNDCAFFSVIHVIHLLTYFLLAPIKNLSAADAIHHCEASIKHTGPSLPVNYRKSIVIAMPFMCGAASCSIGPGQSPLLFPFPSLLIPSLSPPLHYNTLSCPSFSIDNPSPPPPLLSPSPSSLAPSLPSPSPPTPSPPSSSSFLLPASSLPPPPPLFPPPPPPPPLLPPSPPSASTPFTTHSPTFTPLTPPSPLPPPALLSLPLPSLHSLHASSLLLPASLPLLFPPVPQFTFLQPLLMMLSVIVLPLSSPTFKDAPSKAASTLLDSHVLSKPSSMKCNSRKAPPLSA